MKTARKLPGIEKGTELTLIGDTYVALGAPEGTINFHKSLVESQPKWFTERKVKATKKATKKVAKKVASKSVTKSASKKAKRKK